jgi:rubredoxin/uncharacterized membrane protein
MLKRNGRKVGGMLGKDYNTTKKLVRCKVCGYIMEEGRLKDKCPACGMPRQVFEPYIEKVVEKRIRLLRLDLHPVVVHFPQAFVFAILVFLLGIQLLSVPFQTRILTTVQILGILLPIVVLFAFLAGIFDGKLRFKKLRTSLLIRKMIAGGIFFICSVGIALLSNTIQINELNYWITLLLSAICVGCSFILGKIGSTLLCVKVPN